MISRYTNEKLANIWSEDNKYNIWLKIELLIIEYLKNITLIDKTTYNNICKNISYSVLKILENEKIVKHDVVAFINTITKNLQIDGRWIHYGLTSSDLVDTANSLRIKESNKIISLKLNDLLNKINKLALKYENQLIIGRTHGIHGELTTLGHKFINWWHELKQEIDIYKKACEIASVAMISGPMGNFMKLDKKCEEFVAKSLGLNSAKYSSQVIPRYRYANYFYALGLISSSIEKFAFEIRHLQRTEIAELAEGFSDNQMGSSSMPHKKNPIKCEKICGLSRLMRTNIVTQLENISLWNERDISHSSVDRITFPDYIIIFDHIISEFNLVIDNLYVDKDNILKNINLTNGRIYSHSLLLFLIKEKQIKREQASKLVQKICFNSIKNNHNLQKELTDKKYNLLLTKEQINNIFSNKQYIQGTKFLFK